MLETMKKYPNRIIDAHGAEWHLVSIDITGVANYECGKQRIRVPSWQIERSA